MYSFWKSFFKKNLVFRSCIASLIYWYLKIVYATAKFQFVGSADYNHGSLLTARKTIFALWHNQLALGPRIFQEQSNTLALVSSHADGKIISQVISRFGIGIIEGSTNRNSFGALRCIISKLSSEANIVITPDGPRGPVHKINSNITQIAKRTNAKLIPVSYTASHYFTLSTWDKLIMPLPFSRIKINIGRPLSLVSTQEQNDDNLQKYLMELSEV